MANYNRNNIKLSFEGDNYVKYFIDSKNKVVVCKLYGILKCPYPISDWRAPYIPDIDFHTTGKAFCSANDEFNPEIGKKIALARAENAMYIKAWNYLENYFDAFTNYFGTVYEFWDKADSVINHNFEHIQNLSK